MKTTKRSASWKTCALGAAGVVALLTSTACDPAAKDEATTKPSASKTSSDAKPATTASAEHSTGTTPACTTEQLATSAENQDEKGKQARHLLITVQNVGDKKCTLYGFPFVQLGPDAQAPVEAIQDSDPDPDNPTVIAPGKEAYAALLVSGGRRDTFDAESLSISLQGGPDADSKPSDPMDVPLPVAKLTADDGARVTYWSTASGFSLRFIMSS